jgi:hypothetical protein
MEDVKGKKRFHFESFWTKFPGFLEMVASSWELPAQAFCPLERVSLKFRRPAKTLQSWGHKNVGNVKEQLAFAREILHKLEIAQDLRLLTTGELWLKRSLIRHCLALASLERTVARLRSRIRYLREGDANTSFFHMQARYRKKKNFISKLLVGDHVATSHEQKQEVLFDFYSNLLGIAKPRELTVDLEACHKRDIDLSSLDLPITEAEVQSTIACLPLDKTPGPNGYIGRFYKSCWQVIKADLVASLISLHQGNARKLGGFNSAYLTLIPKKVEAVSPGDFRPISLIHSFAKLVTKIMANRLAPLLHKLVEVNQSAFVKGRSIHDNYLMVHHTIKHLHKKKVASLFLKLDVTKAFDLISWAFLLDVLEGEKGSKWWQLSGVLGHCY